MQRDGNLAQNLFCAPGGAAPAEPRLGRSDGIGRGRDRESDRAA
jgi:hypothetical protein